jgi:pyruvate/2-oxoglutarate dehydrogenase complex dihydrolipoamide acyltransferase (E2) component
VTPSKPGESIKKADVVASLDKRSEADLHASFPAAGEAAAPPQAVKGAEQRISLTPIRKTIARRMHESHQGMAAVTYMSQADATRLVKLRKRILKKLPKGSLRPTYTDFLIFIICRALTKHPGLNATFDGELLHVHESIHMALAVDTERGLIVPVIRDAGGKGVEDIAHLRRNLVDSVLDGTVSSAELNGGTFTITNLGTLGIDHFTPIINPPQVAILGVGRIRKVPAVHKGKIRIRHVLGLALTCDHRIIDGAPAARFLSDILNFIENPDLIWM